MFAVFFFRLIFELNKQTAAMYFVRMTALLWFALCHSSLCSTAVLPLSRGDEQSQQTDEGPVIDATDHAALSLASELKRLAALSHDPTAVTLLTGMAMAADAGTNRLQPAETR